MRSFSYMMTGLSAVLLVGVGLAIVLPLRSATTAEPLVVQTQTPSNNNTPAAKVPERPYKANRAGFAESVIDAPQPADEAAKAMRVPEGFRVSLFAAEPAVQQPIGFCIDDRGRLWVAEAYNYPNHGTRAGDRIVILEDTDGDGKHDRRTVFFDQLNYVSGIEVGFGGAWVMSPPYFYFIPDKDGDDKPDGPPQVLLDGFGNHANAHNMANGFAWGPDGWLYGTHGRTNWSLLGKPGTPEAERQRFDGGVYRYHPVRHVWEPFADGTTNPWGIDWNDYGEAFICNCVNPHLFHVIYGAHYEPWRNRESSQYAYERIPTIADHLHFVGKTSVRDGLGSGAEDAAGGGHAHCGSMVYLGDSWPDRYRNAFFTNNIHGRRVNHDDLKREGSGYVASHAPDLMRSQDPWFMGVTLAYGPDGSVFVSDWSDTGECHSVRNTRRETGRIYKISYGDRKPQKVDVARQSTVELVKLQSHKNDWFVRHARRVLHERQAAGHDMREVAKLLREQFASEADVPRKLRALWTLFTIGHADDAFLTEQLSHSAEAVRAWAVRLLCEDRDPGAAVLAKFVGLAARDESPLVRLWLASMLQRLPLAQRWEIATALSRHAEDAEDDNLPLMLWYAIEPLVNDDMSRFIGLASHSRLPVVTRHIGRRVASLKPNREGLAVLAARMRDVPESMRSELLAGMLTGLEGQRSVAMPDGWPAAFDVLQAATDDETQERSLRLALVFDDPRALATLRKTVGDKQAPATARGRAIASLVMKQAADVAPILLSLLDDAAVRRAAIRGLAEFKHSETASTLLSRYKSFDGATRQDVLQTLAARVEWARALIEAVERKEIERTDITAFTARQLFNLNNAALSEKVRTVWGDLRSTRADKAQLIAGFKKKLTPDVLAGADRSAGRAVFEKVCANCHRFFDAGGAIGPNITGSQRTNLDYLLETLIDPSAAVSRDYQMQIFETTKGRVITGLVVSETPAAVTVQTVNEKIVVPKNEIEKQTPSQVSMMPDALLQNLSAEQVRSLLAYLMGPEQVPLPAIN